MTVERSYLCRQPYCPNVIERPGYCPEHQPARTRWGKPTSGSRRGYGTRQWRNASKAYLTAHPTCERCGQPATEVHHLDGRHPDEPGANAWTNLLGLCHPCHMRVEARRRHSSPSP
jgi:5-methylcytosine-specific restriction protein A